jgi:hypothetical protein
MTPLLKAAPILAALLLTGQPAAAQGVTVKELVVAGPSTERVSVEKAARAFYEGWNTGDAAQLQAALSPGFTDHTLPPGRPQGPEGPAFASRNRVLWQEAAGNDHRSMERAAQLPCSLCQPVPLSTTSAVPQSAR